MPPSAAKIREIALAALTDHLEAAGRTQQGPILRRGRHIMCATDQLLTVAYARCCRGAIGGAGVSGPIASLTGNAPASMVTAWTLGTRGETDADPSDVPASDTVRAQTPVPRPHRGRRVVA